MWGSNCFDLSHTTWEHPCFLHQVLHIFFFDGLFFPFFFFLFLPGKWIKRIFSDFLRTFVCLSVCLSVCRSVYLSIYFIYLCTYLFIYLLIYSFDLFTYLLFIYSIDYLFIHLIYLILYYLFIHLIDWFSSSWGLPPNWHYPKKKG